MAIPKPSRSTVRFLQSAIGLPLSSTVTVAVQVASLLPASVAVSITVRGVPISAQERVGGSAENVSDPAQLSVEPLFSSAPVKAAMPLPSSETVISAHTATGGMSS